MAADFPPSPAPLPSAQARRLLAELQQQVLAFWHDEAPTMVQRVRERLQDLADSRLPEAKARHVRSAMRLLAQQGKSFEQAFTHQLPTSLSEAVQEDMPGLWSAAPRISALAGLDDFSLVDVDEVHRVLLIDRVGQRLNARYEAGLSPLSQRLGLLRGQENASLADNPFRPAVFLRAFLAAWDSGPFDLDASEDLLDTIDADSWPDLGALYTELNATLNQAGVQAQTVHRIRKSVGSGFSPLGARDSGPASLHSRAAGLDETPSSHGTSTWGALAPAGRALAAQARQFLQRLGLGGERGEAANAPMEHAPRAAPDAGLMHFLDDWQSHDAPEPRSLHSHAPVPNVLHQLRQQATVRQANELDRGTVDVLAEVFDYVFADRAIPLPMKGIIGRLQIPVLKAAMIDRDFFMSPQHPARQLVDSLATASVGWTPEKGEQDPLYQRIEHTVQRVLTEFEDDIAVFAELLAEFTEFLFENEQQAAQRNAPVATHESSQEQLQQALAQADELVHARLQAFSAHKLPGFLAPFVTHQWREVLAHAWLQRQSQPQRLEELQTTLDQLIWSVLPKTESDDRRTLVELLPSLVRTLNTELDAIAWSGEARATFTQRLIATHMLAIRMKAPSAAPAPDTNTANLEAEASDQALVALEQRRAAQRAREQDPHDGTARNLAAGQWFELSQGGATRFRCKLQWVSPMRTRFLFTNREGFDAFVRSEREVAAMLRMGELHALEHSPIVGRALEHLLASNDDEIPALAA